MWSGSREPSSPPECEHSLSERRNRDAGPAMHSECAPAVGARELWSYWSRIAGPGSTPTGERWSEHSREEDACAQTLAATSAASRVFLAVRPAVVVIVALLAVLLVLEAQRAARAEAEEVTRARRDLDRGDADPWRTPSRRTMPTGVLQPFAEKIMARDRRGLRHDHDAGRHPRRRIAIPTRSGGLTSGTIPADADAADRGVRRAHSDRRCGRSCPIEDDGELVGWVSVGVTVGSIASDLVPAAAVHRRDRARGARGRARRGAGRQAHDAPARGRPAGGQHARRGLIVRVGPHARRGAARADPRARKPHAHGGGAARARPHATRPSRSSPRRRGRARRWSTRSPHGATAIPTVGALLLGKAAAGPRARRRVERARSIPPRRAAALPRGRGVGGRAT